MTEKKFDVVIWGATGFTARLAIEYIATKYNDKITWAVAGRSSERVAAALAEVSKLSGVDVTKTPILASELDDAAGLDAVASSARVIVAAAGPYARIGAPIVDAAIRNGADYVDLTGEHPWIASLLEERHEAARRAGVRIVNSCGFDCVPTDLGTLVMVDAVRERTGRGTAKVAAVLVHGSLRPSGGTLASILGALRENPKAFTDMDPYTLVPKAPAATSSSSSPSAPPGNGTDRLIWAPGYEPSLHLRYAPSMMQKVDTRIVHRSQSLIGYGSDFKFIDGAQMNAVAAWGSAAAAPLVQAALGSRLAAPLVNRLVAKPGSGPPRDWMRAQSFEFRFAAYPEVDEQGKDASAPAAPPAAITGRFRCGLGDAGYWGTSRMLVESALSLALNKAEIDADPRVQPAGVLTPASGIGVTLAKRLRSVGFEIEVDA